MKRLCLLLVLLLGLSGSAGAAGEFDSVYVWYAGKQSAGAPKNELKSKYYFTTGKSEPIKTVTIKGYGDSVRRLHLIFLDKKGQQGSHLVPITKVRKQGKFYTYTYPVKDTSRWSRVLLEYKIPNFAVKNRVYTEPSLFWIEKVNGYQLEPPTDEDDL